MSASRFAPESGTSCPRPHTSTEDQDRFDQNVYSLFDDSVDNPIDVTPTRPQYSVATQETTLPQAIAIAVPDHIQLPAARRNVVMVEDDMTRLPSESPFSGGFCRQLAAMYTDVGMTTVERVRWLCGSMVLVYALTCYAWFAWSAYTVPAVGVLTGTVGLLVCQRPHEHSYLTYVQGFLALNYAQLVLLAWLLFVALTTTCTVNCVKVEAKTVFILLMVLATGTFHWRVVMITRHYLREFQMIYELTMGPQGHLYDASYSQTAHSSIATDILLRSAVSTDS